MGKIYHGPIGESRAETAQKTVIDMPFVSIPTERIIEKETIIEVPVEKIIERVVEKPIHTKEIIYIDKPYEVEKIVEVIVEKETKVIDHELLEELHEALEEMKQHVNDIPEPKEFDDSKLQKQIKMQKMMIIGLLILTILLKVL